MKRSSNVKRSSMDKSLKLGKIIPFAAFGGFFYSRSVNDLKGYNKSYYSEPMYRYKSKFYNGAGQFFGSYRNQSTKVATSNLNKRGGGTIGRAMSRGGFGKAVSVSRGG